MFGYPWAKTLKFVFTDLDFIKIWVSTIAMFLSVVVFQQVTLIFFVGFIWLGSVSTSISNLTYRHMMRINPMEFKLDIKDNLPAILAYYQSTHRKSRFGGSWPFLRGRCKFRFFVSSA